MCQNCAMVRIEIERRNKEEVIENAIVNRIANEMNTNPNWDSVARAEIARIQENEDYFDYLLGKYDEYLEEERIDIGTCQGCGRYGYAGKTCIRMIDGQMEECGEYL